MDFYQAFRFNPFVFTLLVLAIIYLLYVVVCIVFKKNYIKIGAKTMIILVVFLLLFMIFRNINGFEFLKPTIVR